MYVFRDMSNFYRHPPVPSRPDVRGSTILPSMYTYYTHTGMGTM